MPVLTRAAAKLQMKELIQNRPQYFVTENDSIIIIPGGFTDQEWSGYLQFYSEETNESTG